MEPRLAAAAAAVTLAFGLCGPSHPDQPKTAVVVQAGGTPQPLETTSASASTEPSPLPPSLLIKVPYTAQAPHADWSTHEDYCEAAALVMYSDYLHGDKRETIPPDEADRAMTQVITWERQQYHSAHPDLTMDQMAETANHFWQFSGRVLPADLDSVKHQLAAGHPVVIPVMTHGAPGGQALSPHYGRANVYHVMLITGYDGNQVYTNDAGFMQGENQAYQWSVLVSAMDAQQSKMNQGRVMLVLSSS